MAQSEKDDKMNNELQDRLNTLHAEIVELLKEVADRTSTKATAPNPNWGHAGDLGYYRDCLREALGRTR